LPLLYSGDPASEGFKYAVTFAYSPGNGVVVHPIVAFEGWGNPADIGAAEPTAGVDIV
jgi:hypothetical protein